MSCFGEKLLVSLPGGALEGLTLPGSIFDADVLRDRVLPPSLHLALRLVVAEAEATGTRLRFIARPEIFTHGASREWLEARIDGTRHHLALTDGHALKSIPCLRNHVFFHARGDTTGEAALTRLLTVAPELLSPFASQVNGTLAARAGQRWLRPRPVALRLSTAEHRDPGQRAPFRLLPGGAARNARASAEEALLPDEAPPEPRPLHYVPLSEVALADDRFLLALAQLIRRAAVGAEALLIGLPAAGDTLAARIASVLTALVGAGLVVPRAPGWAVRFASTDPSAAELEGARVMLHPGSDFWRFDRPRREALGEVQVSGSGNLAAFARLVGDWFGRPVAVVRPPVAPVKVEAQ